MTTFKLINHDSGPPVSAHWSASIADASNMASIDAAAALGGTACGLAIDFSIGNTFDLRETLASLPGTNEFRFRYRFDTNDIQAPTVGTKDIARVFITASNGNIVADIYASINSSSQWTTAAHVIQDSGSGSNSGDINIDSGVNCVEMAYYRASASDSGDGSYTLYANGSNLFSASGLQIFTRYADVDWIRYSIAALPNPGGTFYIDEILIDDSASVGLCATATAFRLLGIAADSGKVYATGLEDSATLMNYDYSLSDLSEGASPSAFGSATNAGINAACFGIFPVARPGYDDYLYLRGRDGNDVKTQKFDYNDAATGWTDIGAGSATWDASKMAVGMHPSIFDPDDILVAFTDSEVYRTRDEGTSWTDQGSATGNLLTSTRFPTEDNKLFAAGASGAIDYSHNYGVSFNSVDIAGSSASIVNHLEISL